MLRLIDYRCCRNVKRSSGSYNEAFNYVDITTNTLRCCVGSPRRQGMQFRAWARGSRHIGCH